MDPAIAALDLTKAGAILADMVESFLAAGTPPSLPEGADHDVDLQDRGPTSVASSVHLHSSIDAGASALQPGEHRAPVQSEEQGAVTWLEPGEQFIANRQRLQANRTNTEVLAGPARVDAHAN